MKSPYKNSGLKLALSMTLSKVTDLLLFNLPFWKSVPIGQCFNLHFLHLFFFLVELFWPFFQYHHKLYFIPTLWGVQVRILSIIILDMKCAGCNIFKLHIWKELNSRVFYSNGDNFEIRKQSKTLLFSHRILVQ